jgi:hypothetical protein
MTQRLVVEFEPKQDPQPDEPIGVVFRRLLRVATLLVLFLGPPMVLAWFGHWALAALCSVALAIFATTYFMLARSIAMNYPPEGRKPMAMWPSDIPPTPPSERH